MTNTPKSKSRTQIGCLLTLIGFSAFLAVTNHPYVAAQIGIAFGLLALVSLFLRVGWFVPFAIAGVYLGMLVLDPPVKHGAYEAQMNETVCCILAGALVGFAIGITIDVFQYRHRQDT